MITIPLADVVSYLTRKGVDFACLEGAPTVIGIAGYRGNMVAFDAEKHADWRGPGDLLLYLGRDAICPAAMGWAAWVLRCDIIVDDRDAVWSWRHGESEPDHAWSWEGDAVEQVEHHRDATWFPGSPPTTPAARLRAVLEYEMGRDQ